MRTRTRSSGAHLRQYACSSHFHRGATVCSNLVVMPMEMIDVAVLAAIGDLLTPDLVDDVIGRESIDGQAASDSRAPVEAELAGIESQLGHLTETIALAGNVLSVVHRLRGLEQRRQALVQALETMDASALRLRVDWGVVEREARGKLGQWRALLCEDVGAARRVLSELLEGPLRFHPDHGRGATRLSV